MRREPLAVDELTFRRKQAEPSEYGCSAFPRCRSWTCACVVSVLFLEPRRVAAACMSALDRSVKSPESAEGLKKGVQRLSRDLIFTMQL